MKKTLHKLGISILLTGLVIINNQFSNAEAEFTDMSDHWSSEYVARLIDQGITGGYEDGTFRPNNNINVDEFITFCIKSLPNVEVEAPGVNEYWAQPYIDKAIKLRIIEYWMFPNYQRPITREEMSYIVNTTLAKNEVVNFQNQALVIDLINDYSLIDANYKDPVLNLYMLGISEGKPNNLYDPKGNLTRGEAAVVLSRMIDKSLRQPFDQSYLPSIEVEYNDDVNGEEQTVKTIYYAPVNSEGEPYVDPINIYMHYKDLKGYNGSYYTDLTYSPNTLGISMTLFSEDITDLDIYSVPQYMDFSIENDGQHFQAAHYPTMFVYWNRALKYAELESRYKAEFDYIYDFYFGEDADYIRNEIKKYYDIGPLDYDHRIEKTYNLKNGKKIEITAYNGFTVRISQ